MPKDGWVCFHCGERFTTSGSARDHFGGEPSALAGCQIKAGQERGLLMELRKAADGLIYWMNRAISAEENDYCHESQLSALVTNIQSYKPFRKCRSIQDIFNVYDSMEGRALAAEERLKQEGVGIPADLDFGIGKK